MTGISRSTCLRQVRTLRGKRLFRTVLPTANAHAAVQVAFLRQQQINLQERLPPSYDKKKSD